MPSWPSCGCDGPWEICNDYSVAINRPGPVLATAFRKMSRHQGERGAVRLVAHILSGGFGGIFPPMTRVRTSRPVSHADRMEDRLAVRWGASRAFPQTLRLPTSRTDSPPPELVSVVRCSGPEMLATTQIGRSKRVRTERTSLRPKWNERSISVSTTTAGR